MGLRAYAPADNQWSHGTQVTASHGHMAFFGAYAMLNLTMFYYALPKLKGRENYNQRRGMFSFWAMVSGMFLMGLALAVAGVVQAYLNRVVGIDFLTTQDYMRDLVHRGLGRRLLVRRRGIYVHL